MTQYLFRNEYLFKNGIVKVKKSRNQLVQGVLVYGSKYLGSWISWNIINRSILRSDRSWPTHLGGYTLVQFWKTFLETDHFHYIDREPDRLTPIRFLVYHEVTSTKLKKWVFSHWLIWAQVRFWVMLHQQKQRRFHYSRRPMWFRR